MKGRGGLRTWPSIAQHYPFVLMRAEGATAVLGQCASLVHLDSKCLGHTRRATVKGGKCPEVAGVCVVESHKDCIEYHNGQLAEEGNEERLLPPLDPRVDRVHLLHGHVHTVTDEPSS